MAHPAKRSPEAAAKKRERERRDRELRKKRNALARRAIEQGARMHEVDK